jgi:hypothetical protein
MQQADGVVWAGESCVALSYAAKLATLLLALAQAPALEPRTQPKHQYKKTDPSKARAEASPQNRLSALSSPYPDGG